MKTTMKQKLAALLAAMTLVSAGTAAVAASAAAAVDAGNQVLSHFYELTQVPRPSHHEEQISNYLKAWAESRGFAVTQDAVNNIIFDVPATDGMEDRPLTALQAHMDMVFAQLEGLDLDPLTTRIVYQDDGVWMTSDGRTSLGSDDGLGIAMILSVAEGRMAHGPMRMIITVDEEDAMTGIRNMDPHTVDGVRYLINLDYETEGVVMISSAAGYDEDFTLPYTPAAPEKGSALSIVLSGLSGGHSGVQINENRLNALTAMGSLLKALDEEGIPYELASLEGGTAKNAIAASARAAVCLDAADTARAEAALNAVFETLRQEHAETDPGMALTLTPMAVPAQVVPLEAKAAAVAFLTELPNGVYTMHPTVEGLVECSSNLGVVSFEENALVFRAFARSSSQERMEELTGAQKELALSLGMTVTGEQTSEAWEYKEENHLLDITEDAYEALFGTQIEALAVHAGLECGTFSRWNEEMDIIAIGPTIVSPHTVDERFEIATVDRVWQLLEAVLGNVD